MEQRKDYHHKDVFEHTLEVVDNIAGLDEDPLLRFIALVHDIGKPQTKKFIKGKGWTFHGHEDVGTEMLTDICYRLKLPVFWKKKARHIVKLHMRPMRLVGEGVKDSAIRRLIVAADEDLEPLLQLAQSDISSKIPEKRMQHLAAFERLKKRIYEVKEKDKLQRFKSPISGNEIMEL